jgi:hypothetical protein
MANSVLRLNLANYELEGSGIQQTIAGKANSDRDIDVSR